MPLEEGTVVLPVTMFAPLIAAAIGGMMAFLFIALLWLKKDPTIWYRIARRSFFWSLWRSPTGNIKRLAVLEDDINLADNTLSYNGQTHLLKATDSKGRMVRFNHNGRACYLITSDQAEPHSWEPNNSITAESTPQAIFACKDGSIRKQIDSVRIGDKMTRGNALTIFLLVVVALVVIFGIWAMMRNLDEIMKILDSLTGGAGSGSGTGGGQVV